MDPTMRIVGPPGSANATVSGDKLVLTLPTQPFAGPPPVWVIVITAIVLVAVLIAVIWRHLSVSVEEGSPHRARGRVR